MNARYLCWFVMVSAVLSRPVFSQGFVNLNFESANLSGYAPGTVEVPITNALPGWSASYISTQYGSNSSSVVGYDIISIGGTAISVNDTNRFLFVPFRGRYSAWLFGSGMGSSGGPFAISTEISQTGLVPSGTESLLMDVYAWDGFLVTLGGQTINMIPLQTFSNYTLYGGDISMFQGQIATLSLIAPGTSSPNAVEFDQISFSQNAVPEPRILNFFSICVVFWSWRNLRRG